MPDVALATVECPCCKTSAQLAYRLLGVAQRCANCGRRVVLLVPQGGSFPNSGKEVSFEKFLGLLREESIQRAIANWFSLRVSERESEWQINNESGDVIDPLSVHLKIQDQSERRDEIYNLAMTIWRS